MVILPTADLSHRILIRTLQLRILGSQAGTLNPNSEIEPRISRKGTDEERVMETIFKPVWCILISVKIRAIRAIRAIRGQNSKKAPCNFGIWDKRTDFWQAV
jgi:hypothetical protein